MFCGPRGVGKTSAARILAKAVNCPNTVDGEPCATCETCRAIQDGAAIDILEIDAASNRGIEEMRQIREKVGLAPASARYKFYILDEAHMLTTEAFNALLKTLEEPPANTVFVLVTTEARRLPETVLSRCQRLDFRRIGGADSIARLELICREEGVTPEAGVLELITRAAAGSLRDAEGMLDQLVAYAGSTPTLLAARSVLGAAGPEAARELLGKLVDDQIEASIRMVNDLVDQGADPRQIALDVVGCLRNLLLLRTSDTLADLVDEGAEVMDDLRQLARRLAPSQIVELIRVFTPVAPIRGGMRPQLPLEIAVVEAARVLSAPIGPPPVRPEPAPVRSSRPSPDPVVDRARATSPSPGAPATRDVEAAVPERRPSADSPRVVEASATAQTGILWSDVDRRWSEILETCGAINKSVQAMLRAGRPVGGDGENIVLGFRYDFHRERIEDQKNRIVVEDAIGRVFGQRVRVRCAQASRETVVPSDPFQAAMDDPLVKAAVSMGARIRRVTEDSPEEK